MSRLEARLRPALAAVAADARRHGWATAARTGVLGNTAEALQRRGLVELVWLDPHGQPLQSRPGRKPAGARVLGSRPTPAGLAELER